MSDDKDISLRRIERERSARRQAELLLEEKSAELYQNNLTLAEELAERHKVQSELFEEKERAQVTLNSIGDAVISTDVGGLITFLNPVAEQICGRTTEQADGMPFFEAFNLCSGKEELPQKNFIAQSVRSETAVSLQEKLIMIREDGERFHVECSAAPLRNSEGRVLGVVVVIRDITENHRLMERMAYLARHDFLTGLPNRYYLDEQITHSIARAKAQQRRLAILFLDLDRFKNVNDSMGHTMGDQLLKQVATRLLANIRAHDLASRQGGDEFILMLNDIEDGPAAADIASSLIQALAQPYRIYDHVVNITVSVGISVFPEHESRAETLVQHADTALYHAKKLGRNGYAFFTHDMNEEAMARLSLERELTTALGRREFKLYFQPLVRTETGQIVGAEALIRWNSAKLGMVPPDRFIPIAEEIGLIVPLGQWILHEACRQARLWMDMGVELTVAVNLSAIQVRQRDFVATVAKALQQANLPPERLELELTESIVMENSEAVLSAMAGLRELGVGLAMDDFGTGYSSLSYLQRYPINKLKIDRSFIQRLNEDSNDATIINAIISLAKSLGLEITAEGVEYPAQLAFLERQNCTYFQGYLYSKPVPGPAFRELIRRSSALQDLPAIQRREYSPTD